MAAIIVLLHLYLERQEMFRNLIFFNHFGNGDILESREFVKAIMKVIPADYYYYAHGKNPRILLDIPELEYIPIDDRMNPRKQIYGGNCGTLFINTWIGITGKYLLPGIGCTIEKLYEMYNDILRSWDFEQLPGNPIDYIPQINYDKYNIAAGCDLMMKTSGRWTFIDNGLTQSLQAENFDFNPIVEEVARNHSKMNFLVTHEFPTEQTNIHFTSHYTGGVDFDLNEVSFMSLFCDVLIGRNSGPHVYTQVRQNVDASAKKLLSFTYHVLGSSFVVNTPVSIQKYWSDVTNKEDVIHMIEGVLND
jgi:hypothetical protein